MASPPDWPWEQARTSTATSNGAVDANKALLLDSNGKLAGRVIETDGATLDAIPAGATLATRAYVDATFQARDWKDSVRAITAAALPAYTRVGNVLTGNANGALAAVNGITLVANDRFALKDGAAGADNGLYAVTQVGDGSHSFILTRTSDADADGEVTPRMAFEVEEGTLKGFWVCTNTGTITVNTTAIVLAQVIAGAVLTTDVGDIQPIGTAALGSAATAAPADHVHAHGNQLGGGLHANAVASGAAGFLSGADKAKLDSLSAVTGLTETVDSGSAISVRHISRNFTDDESITLPQVSSGKIGILEIAETGGQWGWAVVAADGTVSTYGPGASASFATTDTDNKLAVFKSGTQAVLRNRLGSTTFLIGSFRWN